MRLEAAAVEKWFFRGKGDRNRFYAVQKTDLALASGRVTVLTGRSGSGKTTLIVVTHDPEVAEAAQRTIVLEHGRVAREIINENFEA